MSSEANLYRPNLPEHLDADPPPTNDHLLEVYRQAGENARMYANSRFSNLSAFLTYVSLLTAGLAFLISSAGEDGLDTLVFAAWSVLGVMGTVVSGLFYALERRHHLWWEWYEMHAVADIEALLGYSQYPPALTHEDRTNRKFVGDDAFLGLSATRATYHIYRASIVFFGLAAVSGLALLVLTVARIQV